jgi:hypothetical protein
MEEKDHLEDTPVPRGGTPVPEEKEEARSLNASEWKDIYPYRIEGEKFPKIKQARGLGECYFALGLAAIQECEIYHKFLDECIKKTEDGWEVRFWGADFPVEVKASKINQGPRLIQSKKGPKMIDEIESPNNLDRIIERAYATYEKMRSPADNSAADTMQYLDSGGFSHHFLQILLGDYYDYNDKYSTITAEDDPYGIGQTMMFAKTNKALNECDPKTVEMIFNFLEEKSISSRDMVITCGTPAKGKYNHRGEVHERVKKGRDEFGSGITYADQKGRFVSGHAYGVRSCKLNPDRLKEAIASRNYEGLGSLEIVNPWDTDKTESIAFSEFLKYFRLISPVKIHDNPETAKKREEKKLDTGQEAIIEDKGKDHILAAGGVVFIVSKENGMWKWTNTESQQSKTISTYELGRTFSIGRSTHDGSHFNGSSLSMSRRHFEIKFESDRFIVKSVSETGKTTIKESKEHRPEQLQNDSKLYINDDLSRAIRIGRAESIWGVLRTKKAGKDIHPYFTYEQIDEAIKNATPLSQNYDSAVLEELEKVIQKKGKTISKKVPETASHVKILRSKDNILIIFYISDGQVYYTHYDPRVSDRPRTGSEQMISLLRRVMSPEGEQHIPDISWAQKNGDQLHFNLTPENFKKCLKKDLDDPFDRLENSVGSVNITVGPQAEEYTISRYNEFDFQWRKIKSRDEIAVGIHDKVKEAVSIDKQLESINKCLNHNNTDIFGKHIAVDLPHASSSLHERKDVSFYLNRSQVEGKIIKEREAITSDNQLVRLMELEDGRIAYYYSGEEFWERIKTEHPESKTLGECLQSLPSYLPYTKEQIQKAISQPDNQNLNPDANVGRMEQYTTFSSYDGHQFLFQNDNEEYMLVPIDTSEEQQKTDKKTAELLNQLKTPYSTVYNALSHPQKLEGIQLKDLKQSQLLIADRYKQSEDHEWSYLFTQTEDGWNVIFEINLEKNILHAKALPKA